jgi:hypothetical protein
MLEGYDVDAESVRVWVCGADEESEDVVGDVEGDFDPASRRP